MVKNGIALDSAAAFAESLMRQILSTREKIRRYLVVPVGSALDGKSIVWTAELRKETLLAVFEKHDASSIRVIDVGKIVSRIDALFAAETEVA
jgi:hypothetical protein